MMTRGYIYNKVFEMLWIMALSLTLIACSSNDSGSDNPEIQPEVPHDGTSLLAASTRTVDASDAIHEGAKLWLVLTDGTETASEGTYTYTYDEDATPQWFWSANGTGAIVWETKQYYIYGALLYGTNAFTNDGPNCTVSTSTNYAQEATLTFSNLPPIVGPGTDPLVIVGVQGIENPETAWDVTEGHFGYMGVKVEGKDNVHLKLARIYSAVSFIAMVSKEYDELRTIKITKMELKSKYSSPTAEVTLLNELGMESVVWSDFIQGTGSNYTSSVTILERNDITSETETLDDDPITLTTSLDDLEDFCVGYLVGGQVVTLVTTYNILDKAGNTVRSGCVASNQLDLSSLSHGQKKTIKLVVDPTYLYQLSDADPDDPIFTALNP